MFLAPRWPSPAKAWQPGRHPHRPAVFGGQRLQLGQEAVDHDPAALAVQPPAEPLEIPQVVIGQQPADLFFPDLLDPGLAQDRVQDLPVVLFRTLACGSPRSLDWMVGTSTNQPVKASTATIAPHQIIRLRRLPPLRRVNQYAARLTPIDRGTVI
jgi:hypothetical protein